MCIKAPLKYLDDSLSDGVAQNNACGEMKLLGRKSGGVIPSLQWVPLTPRLPCLARAVPFIQDSHSANRTCTSIFSCSFGCWSGASPENHAFQPLEVRCLSVKPNTETGLSLTSPRPRDNEWLWTGDYTRTKEVQTDIVLIYRLNKATWISGQRDRGLCFQELPNDWLLITCHKSSLRTVVYLFSLMS